MPSKRFRVPLALLALARRRERVERNTLRTTTGMTVKYDLDTAIGTTCNFGWTWHQMYQITPS